ncbi:SpoIIE family protein phosphatase, partial [Kineococcus sp. T13]|uniref:SpoIIE family protein phosphatase n=1 Tax=Kineococcus vitellinus TaxID=2696565 RepID=UPI00141231FB|nr:SpoIIE family protein phosphatase [Kineococcus vitellinus]
MSDQPSAEAAGGAPAGPSARRAGTRDTRVAIEASLLPSLFGGPHVAVVAVDRDGLITALTAEAELLLGYSESELVGEPLHERLHSQRRDGRPLARRDCPVVAALEGARPAVGEDDVLVRADGSLLLVSWAFAPTVLARTLTGGVLTFHVTVAGGDEGDRGDGGGGSGRGARRLALAEAANQRLALLADVSRLLSAAPADLHEALEAVGRRVVPQLADWVVVDLLEEGSTTRARRVALVHRDPALEGRLRSELGPLPPLTPGSASPLAQVLQGGSLQHLCDVGALDAGGDAAWGDRLSLVRRLGAASAITAPLQARGLTLGAVTLVRADPGRPFGSEDLAFVSDLAGRVAATVDTTWLLQREQRRAEQMQRALLPQLPDRVGGLELHGLYQPASDLAQVGGDWYDAFPLPGGGTALVIGDVAGHDLHAATRMGAIRHKLRALAADRVDRPAQVVTRLERVLARFAPDDVATLVHAHLRREPDGGGGLEWTCAGHPPPLLLVPGAAPRFLEAEADLPVGVAADLPRHDTRAALPAGATVVLYSDGLVERREESLTVGLQRLLRAARGLEQLPPQQLCRQLLERVGPTGSDDIAVLVARLSPVRAPRAAPPRAPAAHTAHAGTGSVPVRLLGVPLRLRAEFTQHTEGLLRELALLRIGAGHEGAPSLPQRLVDLAADLQRTYAPLLARPAAAMEEAAAAGRSAADVTYEVPPDAGPFVRHVLAVLEEADEFCRAETHLLTLPPAPAVVAYRRWLLGEFTRQLAGEPPLPWRPQEQAEAARGPAQRAAREAAAPAGAPGAPGAGTPLR